MWLSVGWAVTQATGALGAHSNIYAACVCQRLCAINIWRSVIDLIKRGETDGSIHSCDNKNEKVMILGHFQCFMD